MTKIDENSPKFRAAYLGALLARYYPDASPHAVAVMVAKMQRAATAAKTWEIRRCNDPMSEVDAERGEKRIARMQADLNGPLDFDGLWEHPNRPLHSAPAKVKLGGDPRGPCASLHIPGVHGDGFGPGFGIY